MNRGDIETEVRDILGELVADFWSAAELVRYINEAQRRFNGEATWPWLLTEGTASLAATVADLELGNGIDFTKNINLSLTPEGETRMYQPVRVSPTKGFELRSMYSSNTTSTWPRWFYVTSVVDSSSQGLFTTTIKFIPTPTGTMEVAFQYFRVVDDMTAASDIPDLPVEYHKSLVHFAAATAWLKELSGGPKAQEQFELYSLVVEQAKREFFAEPNDQPLVMGKDEPQYATGRAPADPWLLRMPERLGP